MKLSVPYIPDPDYEGFLLDRISFLDSIYFALHSGPILDSRVRFSSLSIRQLARGLLPFGHVKKYALLNGRFIPPRLYHDRSFAQDLLDTLTVLYDTCGLDGIVVVDVYLLQALDQTGHRLVPLIEAVPGVNLMMDCPPKIFSVLEAIEQTRFRMPRKIVADRSLNREAETLSHVNKRVKSVFPDITIELLANEGCLYQCPFKPAHDAHISLANAGLAREGTHKLNQAFGCHNTFYHHPHKFLTSPFIRPEDLHHYEGLADTIKICGRTLGPSFLKQAVTAYMDQSFDGNLPELMDTTHFLSRRFVLNNKDLGPDFFKMVTSCTKNCKWCTLCPDLFSNTAKLLSPTIPLYEDCQ